MHETNMDMVHGPLLKNIFIFAVPLMLTSLLQMLFNAADTIVVGKFAGDLSLGAVGACGSIIFLLTSLFNGIASGSNVVIAQLLGKQDYDEVSKAVHTSMLLAIISGVVLTVVAIVSSRFFLTVMSTPSNIIDLSNIYMKIYFSGVLFLLIYNFGSAILRSKGDTKRPLYFLMLSGMINVVLNLLFVIVFHLDVVGVASATVISQAVAAILVWITLLNEKDATRIEVKKLKLDYSLVKDILMIGIPAGLQGIVFSFSNIVIQSSINSFDSAIIVAGNSAANNIENFVYIGMNSFAQATMTFTSQNVGANHKKAIHKILYITLILAFISGFLVGFIAWFFGDFFLSLYTNEAAVIEAGKLRLTYVTLLLVLNGVIDVFVFSMRGMGYSTMPTLFMLIGICGIRLLWLWFIFPLHRTLSMIYICFPISWSITALILAILWFKTYRNVMLENKNSV